ncbi:MAG: hypothetical protein VXZ35_14785, partial [Pseudomonadota bacterium]|nr:hypothetical protein [Pseudomonadota bacterium]
EIGSGSLQNIELIKGGKGNNTYAFSDQWGGSDHSTINIDDTWRDASDISVNNGVLDFSGVSSDLKFELEQNADGKVIVTVTSQVDVERTGLLRIGLNGSGEEFLIPGDDTTTEVYRTEEFLVSDTVTYTVTAIDIEKIIGGSGDNQFVLIGEVNFAGDIDGGSGSATLDYSQFVNMDDSNQIGVTVDLTTIASETAGISGSAANINNVIGTEFDDVIKGNALDNRLQGKGGNDTIEGGSGADILDGGLGDDDLKGGEGDDTYVIADNWDDRLKLTDILNKGQSDTVTDLSGSNILNLSGLEADLTFLFEDNAGDSTGTKLTISADVTAKASPLKRSSKLTINDGVTDSDSGSWTLTAGQGDDRFQITRDVNFNGTIDGHEGNNTLDYSFENATRNVFGFLGNVEVNLSDSEVH